MRLSDFRLLKKLMNMTLSGADQEKLTAINAANEIIRKSETTWDRVLDRVIKVELEIESRDVSEAGRQNAAPEARAALKRKIDEAFEAIESTDPRGTFADFVADLKSEWERTGRLSEAQLDAILVSARKVPSFSG